MCKMDILKYYGFVVGVDSNRPTSTTARPSRTQNTLARDALVDVDRTRGDGGDVEAERTDQDARIRRDNLASSSRAFESSSSSSSHAVIVEEVRHSPVVAAPPPSMERVVVRSTRVTEV